MGYAYKMPAIDQHTSGRSILPGNLRNYVSAPGSTWRKGREWLNARIQLRKCNVVGRWTRLIGRLNIQNNGGYIAIGERVLLLCTHAPGLFAVFDGGRLEIGDRTTINYGADFAATGLIRIGCDCRIGTHAIILDNDFHEVGDLDRRPSPKPVIIGDRVWVGNRATILPGVTIGDGSVIGAGSVVMSDIPPHSVAIGNPARVIKRAPANGPVGRSALQTRSESPPPSGDSGWV
jgi:acetyltransferase-like isoleucine patch superfamily enzyme